MSSKCYACILPIRKEARGIVPEITYTVVDRDVKPYESNNQLLCCLGLGVGVHCHGLGVGLRVNCPGL